MVLTNERAEMLANYLMGDSEKAKMLLDLSADDAAKEINADGHDFSVAEIKEFGEQLQHIADSQISDVELNAENLEDVTGGAFITLTAAGLATVFATCCGAGWAMASRHGW